jgi:rSAM/selenodomain-associated transferase 1
MVKTRLAQSISSDEVTALYRCLLKDTLALATSLKNVEAAVMCPEADLEELAQLVGNSVPVVAQKGQGLAAGLTSAFQHFTAGGCRHAIAFNSDSPHLPASILESAFEALHGNDMVVGPTEDGGYYLVGAKAAYPTLFNREGLGTRNALEALLTRARELQLSVGFTKPFYDVDVEGDLTRLAAELQLAPARAPRTAAWLKQWRP